MQHTALSHTASLPSSHYNPLQPSLLLFIPIQVLYRPKIFTLSKAFSQSMEHTYIILQHINCSFGQHFQTKYSRPAPTARDWFQDPPRLARLADIRGKFSMGLPYLPIRRLSGFFSFFNSQIQCIIYNNNQIHYNINKKNIKIIKQHAEIHSKPKKTRKKHQGVCVCTGM